MQISGDRVERGYRCVDAALGTLPRGSEYSRPEFCEKARVSTRI